jgi:hypothetical protein
MKLFLEILGDALLIAFGCVFIFIFVTIEIFGMFGYEANVVMRWFELICGVPIIVLGIYHLVQDAKK